MPRLRKIITLGTSSAALVAALGLGSLLFDHARFAMAQQQVDTARQHLSGDPETTNIFKTVARAVGPSVVEIRVTKTIHRQGMPDMSGNPMWERFLREFGGDENQLNMPPEMFSPQDLKQIGTGSGVIMEASGGTGYILTNNHVAGEGDMVITLADGRVIKDAKLVGADPKTDLAVVEIKADRLIAAKWGDSTTLEQGDTIIAFGAPFGYVGSMTHGIVSALNRRAGILGQDGYENFIQVDAPINPGNSGGPLVNLKGEVVGINTAIASSSGGFQGIGFAVPSGLAEPVYKELRSTGKIVRGWLGLAIISVADASDAARSTGYTGTNGVLVQKVLTDGPASDKLQPGDIVTTLDGNEMKDAASFRNMIALDKPGTEVSLGVLRDGREQTVKVKLGQQPDNASVASNRNPENPTQTGNELGMKLAEISPDLAKRLNIETNKTGVVVVSVKPGSIASQAGVEPGDVITRVNSKDVADVGAARKALTGADVKKGIRLQIENRQGSAMLFLQSDEG